MKKTPEQILADWMRGINNGDLDALIALYDDAAVLIPTFSNRLLSTPAARQEYFSRLAAREDLSIALHEKTLLVQELPGRLFTLGGIYNWRFMVDGELLNFEARFSYVVDLARPRPILHHHSSQIPRML